MRADFVPYCETAEGCPLGDLAADSYINGLALDFVKRRTLFEATKSETVYAKLCADFGLDEDVDCHLDLEDIFQKWHRSTKPNSPE